MEAVQLIRNRGIAAGDGGNPHPMLALYSIPPSLYCAKTRILLRHKQLEWRELPPPGGYGSAEYRQTVPSGNLPALRDGKLLLADSEAIAEYLEERYPVPTVLPGDPAERARIRELSRFHDTRLEPEIRKLFPAIGKPAPDTGLVAAQADAINTRLAQLDRMLAERPGQGTGLTLADCGYPVTFFWIDELGQRLGFATAWPESVLAYRHRLCELPAVAGEMEAYCPVVRQWFSSRKV